MYTFAKFQKEQHVLDHGTLHIHGLRLRHIVGSSTCIYIYIYQYDCIQKQGPNVGNQGIATVAQPRRAEMLMQKSSDAEEWTHMYMFDITHALQLCKGRVEHLYPLKMLMPPLNIAPMHL